MIWNVKKSVDAEGRQVCMGSATSGAAQQTSTRVRHPPDGARILPIFLATTLLKPSSGHLYHHPPHKLRLVLDYSHPPLLQRLQVLEKANVS
jgi:hypothetical protein